MRTPVAFALAACVALAACGSGDERGVVVQPLAFFVGDWHVDALLNGTQTPFQYRVTAVLPTMLMGYARIQKSALEVKDIWYVDELGIARIVIQNNGVVGLARSPGWVGNRLRIEGGIVTPKGGTPIRETITKVGDRAFDAVWEAKMENAWVEYSSEQLRR